jgi:hypothetical protein
LTAVRFGLSPKIARAMNPAFVWVALGAALKQY